MVNKFAVRQSSKVINLPPPKQKHMEHSASTPRQKHIHQIDEIGELKEEHDAP